MNRRRFLVLARTCTNSVLMIGVSRSPSLGPLGVTTSTPLLDSMSIKRGGAGGRDSRSLSMGGGCLSPTGPAGPSSFWIKPWWLRGTLQETALEFSVSCKEIADFPREPCTANWSLFVFNRFFPGYLSRASLYSLPPAMHHSPQTLMDYPSLA